MFFNNFAHQLRVGRMFHSLENCLLQCPICGIGERNMHVLTFNSVVARSFSLPPMSKSRMPLSRLTPSRGSHHHVYKGSFSFPPSFANITFFDASGLTSLRPFPFPLHYPLPLNLFKDLYPSLFEAS